VRGLWRKPTYPARRWPRLVRAALVVSGLLAAGVAVANAYVLLGVRGDSTDRVADVPHAQVAIIPGALVQPDGRMSTMLTDRVRRAAELWHAGKVEKILVSGDHHTWAYDEPDTMRKALVRDGVPPRDIFEDHAGFDTWATMVRARSVFGVRHAVVVTQGFHMSRALYLANAADIDATGLTSDLHPYGVQGVKSDVREVLSRVKAVADTTLDTPAIGGPPIPISGDGRSSWGPTPPPGTPPAGSPARTTKRRSPEPPAHQRVSSTDRIGTANSSSITRSDFMALRLKLLGQEMGQEAPRTPADPADLDLAKTA
jgi:SanA protein